MRLDLLAALNAERAARRAAVLVTELEGAEQRLVREAEVAGDPLAEVLEDRLRSGKSGIAEADGRRLFLAVQVLQGFRFGADLETVRQDVKEASGESYHQRTTRRDLQFLEDAGLAEFRHAYGCWRLRVPHPLRAAG